MTDFDSPWKEALDAYFAPFLELLFPTIHREIDWSRGYEFLDKELLQIVPHGEHGRGEVDKLIKVWLLDGQESWLLLHIEVQAQEEANFARRMFVYNYRIFDRYNREVVSLAVLGDDRANWRPSRYETSRWGCRKVFEFPIVKLLDCLPRAAELEASANPMATVLLAHLQALETRQDAATRKNRKTALVRHLYDRGMSPDQIRQLFRLIDWMMTLPPELENEFRDEMTRLAEEKHMPYVTSIERLAREEGLAEGTRRGLLEGIKASLTLRFGSEGLALMPGIQRVQGVDQLRDLLVAIGTAGSLDEYQQILSEKSTA